ncbi:DUF3159 domain-containing protein [Amnibacterium sp. CER49]|uniref:DUF3159 domain-containing protein n=1 Tax=Amnibacterium sp. CER49 TaxID=3039161 RepID=UPI00244B1B8D|nr:DUF3159 domain-containing protein [Amnibacterium sp. CER49]MDH2442324.1 DUF3159 domain-containing protein [Amnibacterium sp. CER49]
MTGRRDAPATGLARAASAEQMSLRGLVAAIGGPLAIVESVLPALVFVVAYQTAALLAAPAQVPRSALVPCVVAPLVLAALFLAWRLVRRQRVMAAVGGAVAAAASAVLALVTGDANENFVPGLITNAAYAAVILLTLLVRRPLIGLAVGVLVSDPRWRDDLAKRRAFTWLTLLWLALFAVRLVVEVPLYLAGDQVVALGIARIALGLPLYAPVLLLTVLVVQALYRGRRTAPVS